MPVEITVANKIAYEMNFRTLAAQKTTKLWSFIDHANSGKGPGEIYFFDIIGNVTAGAYPPRHSDTPVNPIPHTRRGMMFSPYNWATLVNPMDVLRTIDDPTSTYYTKAVEALNRQLDQVIIAAMTGPVITQSATGTPGAMGVVGSSAFPQAQIIEADGNDTSDGTPGAAAGKNLTVGKLRRARRKFLSAEVGMNDGEQLYVAASPACQQQLLASVKTTSRDYVEVQALIDGKVSHFLGFNFIWMNNLPLSGNIRTAIAFERSGILGELPVAPSGRIDQREDKNFEVQVYAEMAAGAARTEDARVIQIKCDETLVETTDE